MYEIVIDQRKNRLYLSMDTGDTVEIKTCVEKIEDACRALVPGFTCVVAFLRNGSFKQVHGDLLFHIEDLIYAYGAKKIVRVREKGDILDRVSAPSFYLHPRYFTESATTIKGAEKILDGMKIRRIRDKKTSKIFAE